MEPETTLTELPGRQRAAAVWAAIGAGAAGPAVEAGLAEFGARVRFRHPLVRSAAYRSASVQTRQELHAALAEATDLAVDPERRAWHRAEAAPGPDEEVAAELELCAGRAQRRGGLAAAATFLPRREIGDAAAVRAAGAAALAVARLRPRRAPGRWVRGRRPHAQGGAAPLPGAAARAGLAVRLVQHRRHGHVGRRGVVRARGRPAPAGPRERHPQLASVHAGLSRRDPRPGGRTVARR